MINKITNKKQLNECIEIIHKSFETVAAEFNITKENCPNHTSFMPIKKLKNQFNGGYEMFFYTVDSENAGFFSLHKSDDYSYELNTLAVLPEFRHKGIGRDIIEFSKRYIKSKNGRIIKISIVEENTVLREWYEACGFIHTGIQSFPHLPFTVGYMEIHL